MRPTRLLTVSCLLAWSVPAAGQTPACDALEGNVRALAREVLSDQHPYDCCDDTILKCLDQKPVCLLARRLANSVCRQAAAGRDRAGITRALSRRARSMMPGGSPARFDLTGVPVAGDAQAPVQVVLYACARCPLCSKITPEILREVTTGRLKGKARLYFKAFPIKSHEHSTEAGLAFLAAQEMGRFWEYVRLVYERFDRFSVEKLPGWAEEAGMNRPVFEEQTASKATWDRLAASKVEGLKNKVDATPTLFLGGRRYLGDLAIEEIVDVIGEEADRLGGRQHVRPE